MATRSEAEKGNQKHLIHGFYSDKSGLTEAEGKYIENFLSIACSGGLPQDLPLLHLAARQLKRLLKAYRFMDANPDNLDPPLAKNLIGLENSFSRNLDKLYMSPMSRGQSKVNVIKHPLDIMLNMPEDNNVNKG